jgi:serine protease
MRRTRWNLGTIGWTLGAASLALGPSAALDAQLAPAEAAPQRPDLHFYAEGDATRTLARDADGALWLLGRGRRVRTALGTDRVLLVGAPGHARLAELGLAVDEVLSETLGIVAVRSMRGEEDALMLAERLAPRVRAGELQAASPDLAFAHLRRDIAVPPNDPRYGGQWFFDTIRMEQAWSREDGDPSVTIAVVDNGCDLSQPDLAPQFLPGYDALDDDEDPSFLPGSEGNEHGTACAGLAAAATDNGIDVAGTCPECALRCVRLLGAPGTLIPISTDVRAFEFLRRQDDVAVVSNSWGFEAGAPAPLALVREIESLVADGRGGRGALVVFAAGNDASEIGPDELQAVPGVLTVGAINTFDEAASFSNSGECLAMTAPTGTLTTDISGAEGAAPGDVTTMFGGTSSACPIVAGVGGLLASAAPSLTGAELREVLVATVRPAPFATPDERGHDPLYGFGIVDPGAALDRVLGVADAGAGGPDAGAVSDAGATGDGPGGGGCGCRAARSGAPPSALLFGLLVAVAHRRVGRPRARATSRVAAALAAYISFGLLGCTRSTMEARPTVAELRPDTPGSTELPPRYDATDVVESVVSPEGAFRVHFTRSGRHAVPLADADADGVPDHVAAIARVYDEVLARYASMGFRRPLGDEAVPDDNGGDGLFDVYLLDFGGGSDGAFRREDCTSAGCAGYMIQENDFARSSYPSVTYAIRLLASHELFHAVQAAYDDALGSQGSVLSEGTAVWASERFDPALGDLEGLAFGYTSRTDRSLGVDPATAGGAYTYGTGIVFEHLSFLYGDDIVRELWEDLSARSDDAGWPQVLDERLRATHGSSFEASFVALAEWMMFLGARADATRGPAHGASFEPVAATLVSAPYEDRTVRMFPAAIRYFAIESGTTAVVLGGAGAGELDVVAVAFDGTEFSARASGRGRVVLEAPGANITFVALVDGRTSGMSRVVSLCIAGAAEACAAPTDAGAGGTGAADAGAGDAGVATADAAPGATPASGCGCRVGRAPKTITVALWIAALALALARRRPRRWRCERRA